MEEGRVVGVMPRTRSRGNTMALYAAFLVTVGIPLMAMGVDVSRVYLMKVKLRQATEAACQAYANSLDIAKFRDNNELVFTKGLDTADYVFHSALGNNASFFPRENRETGPGHTLSNGQVVKTIVIQCTGSAFIDAVVPFWGNYTVTADASAKTKFSTSK
jgi:hypothetical protein